ncbi:unnamed protein product [Rhizophagus irregularis]|nr:unnamed protein product [Rhizophagus irregularis]CAB5363690.1 unnamed protein product [Rhizophagus irregularis]
MSRKCLGGVVEKRISSRQKKPVISSGEAFSALEIIAERLGHKTFIRVLQKKPYRRTYSTKKASKKTSKTKRRCSGLLLAQTYDSSNEESITEGNAIKLKKKSVKKNGKEVKEVTKKKSTKKKTEQGSRSKTKDNGVKNNNGVKNGQLPENTHAVDLVFGGDARYKRQPIGLRQNNLALNHAIKAYQKAQSSNHEGSGDSQLHKTQLCKSSVICYPKAPNDVASICCKIDTEIILYAVIDE